jgi:SAM-dependent methyltransferase
LFLVSGDRKLYDVQNLNQELSEETQRLKRSWSHHEAGWLRDYLVAGVEDPRCNIQSILSRHFIIHELAGPGFESLMAEEYRFAAALDWLQRVARLAGDPEGCSVTLYALKKAADNAEGLEIPGFVLQAFSALPRSVDGCLVPNYLEGFLTSQEPSRAGGPGIEGVKNTFALLWEQALKKTLSTNPGQTASGPKREHGERKQTEVAEQLSVIEPACGSANDYRFLKAYGIAPFIDYTGFDLCPTNVENARALFPAVRFQAGNVFQIDAPAKSFDFCVVHDLLEHLSIAGMETAVAEICRVTRRGVCLGFFQMEEMGQHLVRPVDDYHWNLLSRKEMQQLFARHGFEAQMIHIGSLLGERVGWPETHNPNAYTFVLRAR